MDNLKPTKYDNHGLLEACYKGLARSVKQALREYPEFYRDLDTLMYMENMVSMFQREIIVAWRNNNQFVSL